MKTKLISFVGGIFIPVPLETLKSLGWQVNDELNLEIVVKRDGKVDYLVVEKKE